LAANRSRGARFAPVLVFVLAASVPDLALAQAGEAKPKWGPSIDFEAKPGTKRSLGEADLFVPLWQDPTTLFFGNLRARLDDDKALRVYGGGYYFDSGATDAVAGPRLRNFGSHDPWQDTEK
jgi:hypothetical protein